MQHCHDVSPFLFALRLLVCSWKTNVQHRIMVMVAVRLWLRRLAIVGEVCDWRNALLVSSALDLR